MTCITIVSNLGNNLNRFPIKIERCQLLIHLESDINYWTIKVRKQGVHSISPLNYSYKGRITK